MELSDHGTGDGSAAGGAGFQGILAPHPQKGQIGEKKAPFSGKNQGGFVGGRGRVRPAMQRPDIRIRRNVEAAGTGFDPRMGYEGDGRDNDANDRANVRSDQPLPRNTFHAAVAARSVAAASACDRCCGGARNVKIVSVVASANAVDACRLSHDAIPWAAADSGEDPLAMRSGTTIHADIINLSIGLFEFCPPRCRK